MRPLQQWRIQNYVCHVLEDKICQFEMDGQSLDSLGAGTAWQPELGFKLPTFSASTAVLGLAASFHELN